MRSESVFMRSLLARLDAAITSKFEKSHLFRVRQLLYLLEELENFSGMESTQFLRSIHQTRAAAAFGYYEIACF
jgi:hypothetical protein